MKIAIIGLGLIGGSLALALKKAGHYIIGIPHREETINEARQAGAIDEGSIQIEKAADADLVFICTPISLIIPKLKELAPHLKKGAIVTDVGSTKAETVLQAEKLMPKGTYFVGGHPMAGKEVVKFRNAEAGLFEGRTYILTKTSRTSQKAFEKLAEIVKLLNCQIVEFDPKTHDLIVGATSHLPLAAAAALVNMAAGVGEKEQIAKCVASGFRDTTRVASGDPILGKDMFLTNKKAMLKHLKTLRAKLLELEKLIKAGDEKGVEDFLSRAKVFRDGLF